MRQLWISDKSGDCQKAVSLEYIIDCQVSSTRGDVFYGGSPLNLDSRPLVSDTKSAVSGNSYAIISPILAESIPLCS